MIENFKRKTEAVLAKFKEDLAGVRANQPTPGLVENILVDYYGEKTPVKHVGSISIAPPRELAVQIWDVSAVKAVAAAIERSDLGVSVTADKNIVRIRLPELSQERRDELIRHVKKMAEQCRIQVRASRDEVNRDIQKNDLSEDDQFKEKEKIQEETEKTNKEVENILNAKIAAINS